MEKASLLPQIPNEEIWPESAKWFGERARRPEKISGRLSVSVQAKRDWSSELFMISSWSRINDFSLSPYRRGILTPKRPMSEYAVSSIRVVCRFAAQDILSDTENRPIS